MLSLERPNNTFNIGPLTASFYGLCLAIGIIAGLFVSALLAKKRKYKSDDIFVLALFVLPLAIIGARIYYCVFSGDVYTFKEFISIWNGGLAVYGSIIGGAVGGLLYCLLFNKKFIDMFDIVVPGLLLGQAIGRIGCYFGGCCHGEIISNPNLQFFPLGVIVGHRWHYATFFMESLWTLIGFILAISLFKKLKATGMLTSLYMIWYGLGRAVIEQFRGDSLMLSITNLRISQILSIAVFIVGVISLVVIILDSKSPDDNKPSNLDKELGKATDTTKADTTPTSTKKTSTPKTQSSKTTTTKKAKQSSNSTKSKTTENKSNKNKKEQNGEKV